MKKQSNSHQATKLDESRRRAQTLSREAHRHLAPLGSAGDRLAGLVQVVLQRDR